MEEEKKDIDVFQDEEPKVEKQIFIDYSNQEPQKDSTMVSRKTAIISIVATFLVLAIIGASFAIGFFVARKTSVSSDMPLLEQAYQIVKKYYYKDITWEEFQASVTDEMLESLDNYSFLTEVNNAAGAVTLGVKFGANVYNEHYIAVITPTSVADTTVAKTRCTGLKFSASSNYRYVEFDTQENCEAENIKMDIGDRLYAVSFIGMKPIMVDGLSTADRNALINASDTLTLYFSKSDGNGGFEDDVFYKYIVTKKYLQTKYAFLYTPEEIGDTTGQTAMIALTAFSGSAVIDFAECAQAFVDAGYKHLILDLRNNGGGSGEILDYIAGCLVNGANKEDLNILYYVRNKGNGKFVGEFEATKRAIVVSTQDGDRTIQAVHLPTLVDGFKMTILTNGKTASSAEALIGALRYYNDTKIVGTQTYGKGVGQTSILLKNGKYYVTVTNGIYYIPTDDDGDGVTEWTYCIHRDYHQENKDWGFIPDLENQTDNVLRPISTDITIARALTLFSE